jgi:chromosome segregation ATPase
MAETAKLVQQLGDASKELATLRAANAKFRAERAQPAKAAPAAAAIDPADEKLSASLKSYAAFKQEVGNIFSEVERVRQENAGLSSQLKTAVEQSDRARAATARLEADLRAEQKSRAEAEKTVMQLRDQLRAVARAVSAAGLSVEKLSGAVEVPAKR